MAGRKIVYGLIVAVTAYIGLMYDGPVPGTILAFELLLLVLMFVVSWVLKSGVSVSMETADNVVDCSERAKMMIFFRNRSFLPVSDAVLRVSVSNCLDDEYEEYDISLRAAAHSRMRIPFTFASTYCGVIRVSVELLQVYDYLRLFRRKKKVSGAGSCVVMPRLHEMQLTITEACRSFDSDSEEFDKNQAGDDPSEIFRVREYRQGDKLSRVHWKMSARLDQMMIKELSRPVSNSVGIYLDLRFRDIDEAQSVFELCYSLSMALLAQECPHRIFWCRKKDPIAFEEIVIRTPEDLTEGMGRLLTFGKRETELLWDAFRTSHPQLAVHRMIAITCMDPVKDMTEFLVPDQMNKSVLTIDQLDDLIEI